MSPEVFNIEYIVDRRGHEYCGMYVQVRIDPEKEESSLYTLCRRWLANDPDARDDKPQQLPVIAASVARFPAFVEA